MEKGAYQMSFRGLSVAEAWRFSREPVKFVLALALKLGGMRGAKMWLPPLECEEPCDEAALSDKARELLLPHVREARALGYARGGFRRLVRWLDPNTKEAFAFVALNSDGKRALFLGYVLSDAAGSAKATVSITGSLRTGEGVDAVFVNHYNYMDSGRVSRTFHVKGSRPADVDAAMEAYAAKHGFEILPFRSLDEMLRYAAEREDLTWETRIARGLFVRADVE